MARARVRHINNKLLVIVIARWPSCVGWRTDRGRTCGNWRTLRPAFLSVKNNLGGGAARKRSGVGQNGYAMGHVERPLAEVFSAMPRCAPLRLP